MSCSTYNKMSYRLSRKDIRFLQIMYKISNTFSLTPNYSFEEEKVISPRFTTIYASSFILSCILGTCWIIYTRIYCTEIRFFEISFEILGSIDSLVLCMLIVSTVLGTCFFKQNEWIKLNNKFQFIDKKLKTRNDQELFLYKNTYIHLIIYLLAYFAFVMYTLIVRIAAKGLPTLRLFALHEFFGFLNFYIQILICNIGLAFKQRYQLLNHELKLRTTPKSNCKYFVHETGKLSRLLGEMVGLFNEIFGWPLVFITGRCVIKILVALNFFTSTLEINNESLKFQLAVSSLGQTANMLVTVI